MWFALACRDLPDDIETHPSEHAPSVLVATFPSRRETAAVRVEDGPEVERFPASVVDGVATARLVGLRPDRRYRVIGEVGGVDAFDVTVDTPSAPAALAFDVDRIDPDADLATGLVLLSMSGPWSGIVAIDGEGEPRWWIESDDGWGSGSPRPTADGRRVLWIQNDLGRELVDQRLVEVAFDGATRVERTVSAGHHMIAELDGGEYAWPSWDVRHEPWIDGALMPVLGDRLLVGDGVGEPRTVLSFFDDRGPAYVPCTHGEAIDDRLGQLVYEWTHTNSVVWLPQRDVFIVVARLLDAILEVDRQTGAVGWQLGGRDGTLAIAEEDRFSHGHMSDAWDGGLLMFDNGSHHREKVSRVVEYAIDPADGVAEVVWEHVDPYEGFYAFLGDARRLPSGDVAIAWSTGARVEEVARDHTLRWRLWGPDDATFGRMSFLPALR
ncbi:MAG: aryl-sulfate sulfotransferase [Myxococcota bacterium]